MGLAISSSFALEATTMIEGVRANRKYTVKNLFVVLDSEGIVQEKKALFLFQKSDQKG